MRVQMLGMSTHDTAQRQYVSSYLINGTVAIDAGCLGFHGTPYEQETIRDVFLTHSHVDHTASLPIFIENAWTPTGKYPRIYGSPETLDAVQRHIFNNVMWPDFVFLSKKMHPFLRLCPLDTELPVEAGGLRVTPVRVNRGADLRLCHRRRPNRSHRCWRYWTNRTIMGSRAPDLWPEGSVLGGVFPEFAEAPGGGVPSSHPRDVRRGSRQDAARHQDCGHTHQGALPR
jgi:cAMP phosphodiesterases class-II